MPTTDDRPDSDGAAPLRAVPAEVVELIGRPGPVRTAYNYVDRTAIAYFCEFSENADPRYDSNRTDRVMAPATYVLTAMRTPTWAPGATDLAHQLVTVSLPLGVSKSVNVSVEHESLTTVFEGDRLSFRNTIVDVIPKINRLGSGFLITERVDAWNQDGQQVAVTTVTTFAYGTHVSAHPDLV